ncbi:MAG TPA: histidine kinase [Propionicimonas sp.]|nr:histidine kinase [Propionicimonas sp.]
MYRGRRERLSLLSLARTGRLDMLLAGLLAILVLILELATRQPWQMIALDLAACAAAAAAGRWLVPGNLALGAILLVYLVIPTEWGSLGEYAGLISIIGTGMRRQSRARTVISLGYLAFMTALSFVDTPAGGIPWLGPIIWAVIIAATWLIGNTVAAIAEAQQLAHEARLLEQRRVLARELHDTLARSLSSIVMAAERARLKGNDSPELVRIADTGRASVDHLRLVMNLLRNPADTSALAFTVPIPLREAVAAAADQLQQNGFTLTTNIAGRLDALDQAQATSLGAVVGEISANIVRHGDPAASCSMMIDISDTTASLAVINGTVEPLPGAATPGQGEGAGDRLGLWGVRQRVEALGGTLTVEGGDHRWTTMVNIPLRAPERTAGAR